MDFQDYRLKQDWHTMTGHEYIETTYEANIPLWVKKSDYPHSIKDVKSYRHGKIVYESIVHISEVK